MTDDSQITDSTPPWQISQSVHEINITGYVFPWKSDQPVLVVFNGTNDFFLPVFSSADRLRDSMTATKVEYDFIKLIGDQVEFLANIPTEMLSGDRIRIIVDPYIMGTGNTRFREIVR